MFAVPDPDCDGVANYVNVLSWARSTDMHLSSLHFEAQKLEYLLLNCVSFLEARE